VTVSFRIETGIREYSQKEKAKADTVFPKDTFKSCPTIPPRMAPSGMSELNHMTNGATKSTQTFRHFWDDVISSDKTSTARKV
jgi:hypothetical protein